MKRLALVCSLFWGAVGCATGEASFVGKRLPNLCSESYYTCAVTAGCLLDDQHYVRGTFPGARRVVVQSELEDANYRVRLYLSDMQAPGTELLLQFFEPDCSLNGTSGRVHLEDVDLFAEAGQDRTLIFDDLQVGEAGEHLVEIFSDASAEYLLIVEPFVAE